MEDLHVKAFLDETIESSPLFHTALQTVIKREIQDRAKQGTRQWPSHIAATGIQR